MLLLVAAAVVLRLKRCIGIAIRVDSGAGTASALAGVLERTALLRLLFGRGERVARSGGKSRERDCGDEKSGFLQHDNFSHIVSGAFQRQTILIT